MKSKNTFRKSERIVSQRLIDELFTSGQSHSLAAFPLRAVYIVRDLPCGAGAAATETPGHPLAAGAAPSVQLLISVSKRHFKHAVDRNRVKRQLREAYRLSRPLLAENVPADQQLCLAFIWLSDSHAATEAVAARVRSLLKRIAARLESPERRDDTSPGHAG